MPRYLSSIGSSPAHLIRPVFCLDPPFGGGFDSGDGVIVPFSTPIIETA